MFLIALKPAAMNFAIRFLIAGKSSEWHRPPDRRSMRPVRPSVFMCGRYGFKRLVGRRAADSAAALGTAKSAVAIAEASSLDPPSSALVGAALMALAETERALGDTTNANAAARRAGQALAATLGPDHSETRAALNFR